MSRVRAKRYLTVSEVATTAIKAREELNSARRLATETSGMEDRQENGGPPLPTRVKFDTEARLRRARAALLWTQRAEDSVRHLRVVLERMVEELEKEMTWH